jgi:hypothetical protein
MFGFASGLMTANSSVTGLGKSCRQYGGRSVNDHKRVIGTNSTGELITSGLSVIHPESAAIANPASNLPEPLRRGPRAICLSVLNPRLVNLDPRLTLYRGVGFILRI